MFSCPSLFGCPSLIFSISEARLITSRSWGEKRCSRYLKVLHVLPKLATSVLRSAIPILGLLFRHFSPLVPSVKQKIKTPLSNTVSVPLVLLRYPARLSVPTISLVAKCLQSAGTSGQRSSPPFKACQNRARSKCKNWNDSLELPLCTMAVTS